MDAEHLRTTTAADDSSPRVVAPHDGQHGEHEIATDATMAGWLGRVAAGDQGAARELVAALEPMVRRIVRARRPRRIAEEDLMQEVFMKVFARLGQYHGDAPFPHWVARIAVTTCVDHGRAWQRRPELRWADLAEWETEFLERVTDDQNGVHPGEGLATRELVEKLLGRLKPEDRRVIVLFEMERRSILEICAETGWSFEFTKMRLFRARRKLCRMVATAGGFDGALWGWSAAAVPTWKGKAA